MPTYSWILENDLDAIYESQPAPITSAPLEPTFKCPFCDAVYLATIDLDRHVVAEHFVLRPFLLIDGCEPPSHAVWRRFISPDSVHAANSTSITVSIDSQQAMQVAESELAWKLSSLRRAEVLITLSNSGKRNVPEVSESYRLSFEVAESSTLASVEEAFNEIVTPSDLAMGAVGLFLNDPRCSREGRDYAIALSSFALGILHREDPDSVELTTPSHLYRTNYIRAEEGLREVDRPLARLITQLTRFALNDFSSPPIDTGFWKLDLAYRLLHDPSTAALEKPIKSEKKRRQVCPIDHNTSRVLDLVARMAVQQRWSPLLSDECRVLTESVSLDAMDQKKVAAVWAATAWRLGERESAIEPLRMIAATYPFERWASPLLEELTT